MDKIKFTLGKFSFPFFLQTTVPMASKKSFLIFKINKFKAAPLSDHIFKSKRYTGVSAKTYDPNIVVIFQGTFVKFKMQIF
jgi:hypothetical protein